MLLEIDEIINEKLINDIPLSAMDKVNLARDARRPKIQDYIDNLFTDFFEQKGDMLGKEDGSILGGIAGQYQNMQPGQAMQNTINQNVNGIPNIYGTQTVTPSGVNVMSISNS